MEPDTCPNCGGTSSTLISPGRRQCTSSITDRQTIMVDDPRALLAYGRPGQIPQVVEHRRTCGHTYDVDTPHSTTLCQAGPGDGTCGAYAVGQCADCHTPVCNHHAQYHQGQLVCDTCRHERERPAREAKAEAHQRAQTAAAAAKEEHEALALAEREEYERLTPGYPYPPAARGAERTYAERIADAATLDISAVPIRTITDALAHLLPNGTQRCVVKPNIGLIGRATTADGWYFELGPHANNTPGSLPLPGGGFTNHAWLFTPGGKLWVCSHRPSRDRHIDMGHATQTNQPLPWNAVLLIRNQVLERLAPTTGRNAPARPTAPTLTQEQKHQLWDAP